MGAPSAAGLTPQQAAALSAQGVSVSLAAGAGCGKTFVLTERFLQQVDPHGASRSDLAEVVAFTFTDRAAREMRDRIRKKCLARLLAAPDDAAAGPWLALLRDLDRARVGTIHSFAGALLRQHAVEAALDPQFEVLDTPASNLLVDEVLDDVLRQSLAAQTPELIDRLAAWDLHGLHERLAAVLKAQRKIDFAAWERVDAAELAARWELFHVEQFVPRLLESVAHAPEARVLLQLAHDCLPEMTQPKMVARLQALGELLPQLQSPDVSAELLAEIRTHATVQYVAAKHWPSDDVYENFKNTAKALRELLDDVQARLAFDPRQAREDAAAGLALLRIARPFAETLLARKAERNALDYDDLLQRARDLLHGPQQQALRQRVARQIKLLLVDEFQDTDPVQVELVEALCDDGLRTGKLFFVGDHKQSIYRFRGADPRVFHALRQRMPDAGRLPLARNFRSQPAILRFVNALFHDELGPDYEPLEAARPQLAEEPCVEFLWALPPDEAADHQNRAAGIAREADLLARRLRELLADPTPRVVERTADGREQLRPARPGDVAILFRALSNLDVYERALQRQGIEYYIVGGRAFFAQQELYDVLNLLRAVVDATDEIALAGALRSPFFALSDETLFWLAQHPGGLGAGLFSEQTQHTLAPPEREHVESAAATLAALRYLKERVPIAALLQEALARTGFDAALLGEFLGERKLANLHKLLVRARAADAQGNLTLGEFVEELSQMVAAEIDEAQAATQPEATHVVRLMTYHAAKGLEFPIVAVADLDRGRQPDTPAFVFHDELGPLVRAGAGERQGVSGLDLARFLTEDEDRAESARLFYVAATRAADYLILSSSLKSFDKLEGPAVKLLGRHFDPQAGVMSTPPPDAATPPRVRVVLAAPEFPPVPRTQRVDWQALVESAAQAPRAPPAEVLRWLAAVPADRAAQREFSFSQLEAADRVQLLSAEAAAGETPDVARGQDFGTLVHELLAEIDLRTPAAAPLAQRMQRAAAEHPEFDERTLAQAEALVERFLRSPRAAVLRSAPVVHRELEFLLAWPPLLGEGGAARSIPPETGGRRFRGFIDCLYQTADGAWHVLDYKSHDLPDGGHERAAAAYELQLALYALAAEAALGRAVATLTLHFLRTGQEVQFPWHAAARQEAVRRLSAALEASATAV